MFLNADTLLVKDDSGNTVLTWLSKTAAKMDVLLGIDFGDNKEVRNTVGETWWARNEELLREKTLGVHEENMGVELF